MAYEMIVGLNVTDDGIYTEYRTAMAPILKSAEGGFRYDFKIAEVLKTDEDFPINRVFAIYFGSFEQKEKFFSNPEYLEIRKKYFDPSVAAKTIIAEYEK